MEQAEQLLREWCERHPGWTYSTRQIGPLFADDNLRGMSWALEFAEASVRLQHNVAWTVAEAAYTYENPRAYRNREAAQSLIRAAEQWIEANTNEGGCTPTRR